MHVLQALLPRACILHQLIVFPANPPQVCGGSRGSETHAGPEGRAGGAPARAAGSAAAQRDMPAAGALPAGGLLRLYMYMCTAELAVTKGASAATEQERQVDSSGSYCSTQRLLCLLRQWLRHQMLKRHHRQWQQEAAFVDHKFVFFIAMQASAPRSCKAQHHTTTGITCSHPPPALAGHTAV